MGSTANLDSINMINCDICTIQRDENACNTHPSESCEWIRTNTSDREKCINKCNARKTKGECEQFHEWNQDSLSPVIYDFDGTDNKCQWYPYHTAVDYTYDSIEGTCRERDEICFETCQLDNPNSCLGGVCTQFKEGHYCIPEIQSSENYDDILGEVYCGYNYIVDNVDCRQPPT